MVLNAENVRREYGDTVALDGVSLSVDRGTVFALIGPNGAGKTTLTRSLTGTTDYEGTVELLGAPPERTDTQRIGLLPQSFAPPERLTARELIEYYGGLYEEARSPTAVLEDVGLTDAADTWYESLSGGQQRRVCVGIALVNDPELLVLDEPTTGIDPAGRRDLWRLLERLTDDGTTVVLTTHYMEEAEYLADTVGLLADGSLVATGPPQTLIEAYGGSNRLEVELAKSVDPNTAERATEPIGNGVDTTGRTLTIHGVTPRAIGDVLDALDDAGIDYDALSWRQPDLESVYLELTGTSRTETPASNADRTEESTTP
ncbi:ABC transporter ATP-binding protein [Halocatena salina]|uniref:ABC transporter ATP-binding protein n=1 Tax=Halocatena salina TaxID=2934340 RepID=A0A8U0A4A0_9EURY|nr:ABC transporter ATP-binding protein [Halocatena salina]UPM43854.1 ABC transporter ATP-binding protein [Halocatena salina]